SQLGTREEIGFDMEADSAAVEEWFSETSISEILWDLYDDAAEPNDNVSLGFGPIYETMTGPQIQTEALTSIFSFADALKRANPAQAAAINALLSNEGIVAIDAFGTGETNNGSVQGVLPIYEDLIENQPLLRCVTGVAAGAADNNKLGNRRLFRLANDRSRLVTINVIASAGSPGTQ